MSEITYRNPHRPEPLPTGMHSLYYVQTIACRGPVGELTGRDVTLHFFHEVSTPQTTLWVGPQWVKIEGEERQMHFGRRDDRRVNSDGPAFAVLPGEAPRDGWVPKRVRCDQTGGMCMVDVVEFWNGWVVSLNDECAILWSSLEQYDEQEEPNGEALLLWV